MTTFKIAESGRNSDNDPVCSLFADGAMLSENQLYRLQISQVEKLIKPGDVYEELSYHHGETKVVSMDYDTWMKELAEIHEWELGNSKP